MFRRFLITWLVLSILGYGMAMAADVHNELSTNQTHVISDHAANFTHADNADDCDHCCHGIFHLLGLVNAKKFGFTAYSFTLLSPYSITITTPPNTTPFRPPILT